MNFLAVFLSAFAINLAEKLATRIARWLVKARQKQDEREVRMGRPKPKDGPEREA